MWIPKSSIENLLRIDIFPFVRYLYGVNKCSDGKIGRCTLLVYWLSCAVSIPVIDAWLTDGGECPSYNGRLAFQKRIH